MKVVMAVKKCMRKFLKVVYVAMPWLCFKSF